MDRRHVRLLWLGCVFAGAANAQDIDYARTLSDIAKEIAALKTGFPQLRQFEPVVRGDPPQITYAFHTHAAPPGPGWTSGVPNPDDDGIWFYLDFHDPDSTLQIHTQPVIAAQCIGDKRVSLLILEGHAAHRVEGEIQKILRHHGVGRCERPRRASEPTARIS